MIRPAFWRDWLRQSTYTGRWREMVSRSAMTLKLLTYHPTGAPVAAATAGLPEDPGGERNWDYRFTWVRDGSFSIYALLGLGYTEEAAKFGFWMQGPGDRAGGREVRPAEDHVPGRRDVGSGRGGTEALRGLARREAGQDRQRCRRPAAARHLRRGAGRRLPGRPERLLDRAQGLAARRRHDRLARPSTGTSRTRASGKPGAAARTSPTAGSSPGSRSTGRSGSPSITPGPLRSAGGPWSATGSTTRSWTAPGTPGSRRSPSTTTATCSTRRCS